MKVFRVLHPGVTDGFIVREARSTHGVNKDVPLSQSFSADLAQSEIVRDPMTSAAAKIPLHDTSLPTEHAHRRREALLEDKTPECLRKTAFVIFSSLVQKAEEHPQLFDFLISNLKCAQGKQSSLLARGVVTVEHPDSIRIFREAPGDNSLK